MCNMEKILIGVELRALSNAIRRYFEFSSYGQEIQNATGNNKWILHYLAENHENEVYQKDIETHFNIARSTVSKVLNLMEQKGLIQRQTVPHDARLKRIVLTEQAWKLRELMREDAEGMEKTLTKGFTEDELKVLYSYLKRMRKNMS